MLDLRWNLLLTTYLQAFIKFFFLSLESVDEVLHWTLRPDILLNLIL